jgi:hypothetical protein
MSSVAVTFVVVILGDKVYDIFMNVMKHYRGKRASKKFFKSTSEDKK